MDLRGAAAPGGARVLGGGVARMPPGPRVLRGRRRLSVLMSVATTEASSAAAAVGASEGQVLEARNSKTVVAVILGGGAGTRLFPLTKRRAKPAVPIGGAYRLIDVPMSNCINSGINKVYILTQFNSASLNRHLSRAYDFSNGVAFGDGFVEVLAATQTPGSEGKRWFQGTADAVRQFDWLFDDAKAKDIEDVLILSGDHLYRMDYMDFVQSHRQRGAGISICCLPIDDSRASDFGLMKIDDTGRVISFSEKPKGDDLKAMQVDTTVLGLPKEEAEKKPYIASMGIYIFKKDILLNLLRWRFPTANDFGSEIIPASAKEIDVKAYLFNDYWEDIGTIKSFFEANLALAEQPPRFSFYDANKPMYTSRRNLPPSMVNNSKISDSIISHGCFLDNCRIEHSVVGVRSRIGSNVHLKDTVMLGADYYETDVERGQLLAEGKVPIGIGENTTIRKCIIDKNALWLTAAKWKVGDLVLAKMKGFPAWPATISEPEQWGLSSARKKLLVYFYGTKQIAFCNYADLEAFTEEKKRSLLAKRHGKGADFLRAVDEIIEVYDSLKEKGNNKLDLAADEVKPGIEKLSDNNRCMDTESLVNSSNTDSDKKLEDHLVSGRSHDVVNSDGPSDTAMRDEHCIVNSAPDEPTENVSILDEMRDIPLATTSFSKKRRDAQSQNCYTRSRVPSLWKSRSSLSVESRKAQGSGKLLGHTSLDSVDLVPDDNKEDSNSPKHVEDDKINSVSVSKPNNVWLHPSGGTLIEPGICEASNINKKLNPLAKVDSTCNSEASENRASETELKSNGTSNFPMNTSVIFKRKRKSNRKPVPHSTDCTGPNKDEELQADLSENLVDSPNSKNEVNTSNGDEHLPLVKRARVRMGRAQLEDPPVDEIDVSNNKAELDIRADQCDIHSTHTISGHDYSAGQVSSVVNTVSNPSSKFDMPVLSGESSPSWKNKEYQRNILALDVEAALPPSKRLHRALEAMSANVAETINSLPEVAGPNDLVLNGSLSLANINSIKSADAVVTASNRSAIVQSPGPSLNTDSMHSPADKMYTSESILQNNNVPDSASVPSEGNDNDNHITIKGDVCEETNIDSKNRDCSLICNDVCGKASALCMKLNGPVLDVTQTTSVPDRLSSSLEKDGGNNNVTADAIQRDDETVIAESTNNVGDTTSNSSLATKSSSILSDADTRPCEVHTFSALALKELNHRNLKEKCTSPDSMPMKELIAVAQARRFSRSTSFPDNFLNAKYIPETLVNTPPKEGSYRQLSPSNRIIRSTSTNDNFHSRSPFDNIQQKKLAGHDEANALRRAFKDFLGTLTRTKESIARATRLAIECAKFGIAGEAIDVIVEHLEKESNLYKRVDLFFLVDSITQCSRNQKGGAGDVYPSLIQAVLPRILYAAAPPGNSAWENRRQCLKVLKLWLERKTLSESIIRHHIREIEAINEASFGSSRRPSRTERALNDPLRDNEGMLVDEYGSNAGFELPNLICTKVLEEEEGSSSEDRSFEAVTPEQDAPGNDDDNEESQMPVEKHRHMLEEVDGELEMEDVAPPSEVEPSTKCRQEQRETKSTTSDQRPDAGPPLPVDRPPSPPPLPSSPPPVPPPPPASISQSTQMQPKLKTTPDPVGPHPPRATYNVQSQQPQSITEHPGNMNPSVAPLPPPPFCNSGYGAHPNQIPPPPPMAPLNPPGPHGNFPPPPAPYHGNNYHRPPTASIPNEGYHLQPPLPPPPLNQFPCVPPEPQQRSHHWGNNCSSYPERYRYDGHDRGYHRNDRRHHGHDRERHFDDRGYHYDDRGYHYDDRAHYFDDRRHHFDDRGHHFDDRAIRGPMHHERGRFPPFAPDHFEASPAPMHFGRPSDPPPGPCAGWSRPPRISNHSPSRHSMEPPVSHVAGGHGSWRPR